LNAHAAVRSYCVADLGYRESVNKAAAKASLWKARNFDDEECSDIVIAFLFFFSLGTLMSCLTEQNAEPAPLPRTFVLLLGRLLHHLTQPTSKSNVLRK
jgi:hypothetical protein